MTKPALIEPGLIRDRDRPGTRGYVSRGRKAEDGRIDDRYNLVELSTSSYPARTRRDIGESDGAVIFSLEPRGNDVAPKSGQESKLNDSQGAMNDTLPSATLLTQLPPIGIPLPTPQASAHSRAPGDSGFR